MGVDYSAIAAYGCPVVNITDAQFAAVADDAELGGPGVELIRFDARRRRDGDRYILGVELGRADVDFGVEGLREVPREALDTITAAIKRHGLQTDEHEPLGLYIGGVVW